MHSFKPVKRVKEKTAGVKNSAVASLPDNRPQSAIQKKQLAAMSQPPKRGALQRQKTAVQPGNWPEWNTGGAGHANSAYPALQPNNITPPAGIVQRAVVQKGEQFFSDQDLSNTGYSSPHDAGKVDEVLGGMNELIAFIRNGAGRMNGFDRARVARLQEGHWPSWVPEICRLNKGVMQVFGDLLRIKKEKEQYWRQALGDPGKCFSVLNEEGYANAGQVYQSYHETKGGLQAGYENQLNQHVVEMMAWQLQEIEPHYISSQGDTKRRGDSLLIFSHTQDPQSQYYPSKEEKHRGDLRDHKMGYRTDEMAQKLKPSVDHASKIIPVVHDDEVLDTSVTFKFPYDVPTTAKKVIKDTGDEIRGSKSTSFPGGLRVNDEQLLGPVDSDDLLKRQCGCTGLSNEDAAHKIWGVVNGYLFDQGVLTQVGMQLRFFDSLTDWFNDIARQARAWLKPHEIHALCRKKK